MGTYFGPQEANTYSVVAIIKPDAEIYYAASSRVWRKHIRRLDVLQGHISSIPPTVFLPEHGFAYDMAELFGVFRLQLRYAINGEIWAGAGVCTFNRPRYHMLAIQ
jgi:hypothetical protein